MVVFYDNTLREHRGMRIKDLREEDALERGIQIVF